MKNFRISLLLLAGLAVTSCSHLSKEARQIIGTYYNPELSQTEPVMQLRKDATCTVTAMKPGVLTYSVDGNWDVTKDSLIIELTPGSIRFDGDSTLIGDIPTRVARKIISHNDFSLQLESGGVSYLFQRRNE